MKGGTALEGSHQRPTELSNGDKVIPEDMFEHLDPAMPETSSLSFFIFVF